MRKTRGFRLRHRLVKIFKWRIQPRSNPNRFQRLKPPSETYKPISKFFTLARFLQRRAKELCSPNSGHIRIRDTPVEVKPVCVPKGHLAVYVGKSGDDPRRYLVPVMYFNHPLFGDLLKEAEKVYGFNHPGRIVIPCGVSEFEKVHKKIAALDQPPRRRRKNRRDS